MRKLSIFFLIMAFIFVFGACNQGFPSDLTSPKIESSIAKEGLSNAPTPPKVELFITKEGSTPQNIEMMQLGFNWTFRNDFGQSTSIIADSPHALQLNLADFENATILTNEGLTTILMQFEDNHELKSISAKRWNANYLTGDQEMGAIYEKFEEVEVKNNRIFVESTGNDYIYEIVITWSNGSSSYTFRTNYINNVE